MLLRDATEADVEVILSFIRQLAEYEQLAHEVRSTPDHLRRHLFGPAPVARATLALVGTEPAGMALWWPTFSTFVGEPGIWLEDLFVSTEHRGQGLGRALLGHLRERTQGRVEWDVLDWNQPAIDFYDALGARPRTGWTKYRW